MDKAIIINPGDNVAVALENLEKGNIYCGVTLTENIKQGHKFALIDIPQGSHIIKYGNPIGSSVVFIKRGSHVHTHNTATNLSGKSGYEYNKQKEARGTVKPAAKIQVYVRPCGRAAIRNELWIIPTVGCVNAQAQQIAEEFRRQNDTSGIDGVFAFSHPYGCSQVGDDHERTRKILRQLVLHPNAGGVLVLGLGCENNNIEEFRKLIGDAKAGRVKYLTAQDVEDEISTGTDILKELYNIAKNDKREERDIGCLKIGLKCGGSDGMSGITANPLLGMFSDYLVAHGGSTVLTEVPEMFGAEHLLMNRARDEKVFDKTVELINGFKDYYGGLGIPVYENPSPGNKDGGITTLEDKSLGCTQKAGSSEVVDVLTEGENIVTPGLNLLNGPGNDMVAVTNLGAAGCHMVLFTTGRGTPFGGCVPTVKVSTNDGLFNRKPGWMDFNAGRVLTEGFDKVLEDFIDFICGTASGAQTKNELTGSREIAIFKTGATL